MKPNYQGNKKRKEDERRKKQEAKRLKRLNKPKENISSDDFFGQPGAAPSTPV